MINFNRVFLVLLMSVSFIQADQVAMMVNDQIITESEFELNADYYQKMMDPQSKVDSHSLRAYIADHMALMLLIKQFAVSHQLDLTEEEQQRVLEGFSKSVGVEAVDLENYAQSISVGYDWLKQFVLTQSLQHKVGQIVLQDKISVSAQEVNQYQQEIRDAKTKYLLKTWVLALEDPQATVGQIKQIKIDWASTGRNPLIGEVRELGWRTRDAIPDIFLNAIEGVDPGNLVGPVESEFGMHLVWFEKIEEENIPSDSAVYQILAQSKYNQEMEEWLKDLLLYSVVIKKAI